MSRSNVNPFRKRILRKAICNVLGERVEIAVSSEEGSWKVDIGPVLSVPSICGWCDPLVVQSLEVDVAIAIHIDGTLDVRSIHLPRPPAIPERSIVVGVAMTTPVCWVQPIGVPLVAAPEIWVLESKAVRNRIHIEGATSCVAVGRPVEWLIEGVTVYLVILEGVVVLPVFVQCRGSVSITADVEGGQVRNRRYSG